MLLIIKHNHKVYSKFYYRLFIIQRELLRKEILETYIEATDIAIGYYSLLYNQPLSLQAYYTVTTTTKPFQPNPTIPSKLLKNYYRLNKHL